MWAGVMGRPIFQGYFPVSRETGDREETAFGTYNLESKLLPV
jgi:hypothetical protein